MGRALAELLELSGMSAQKLLERLNKVKSTGQSKWIACCPAHNDKTPSLGIRETGDGTLLIHCWSGCGAVDIVEAVGLEMSDLFPELDESRSPLGSSQRWMPADALNALGHHTMIVALTALKVQDGKPIKESHIAEMLNSARVINSIKDQFT